MDELRRTEVQALEQRLSAAQATAKSAVDAQVAHLEREAAALATQLQEAREHGAKASVQAVEQLQTQLKALQASLDSKDKEVNELKEAARTRRSKVPRSGSSCRRSCRPRRRKRRRHPRMQKNSRLRSKAKGRAWGPWKTASVSCKTRRPTGRQTP